ncbi:hypothetical protein NBRC110019_26710 [Neptunitalea chrysea]|uniref:Uncharacterized protein n=1 Tax=Neptunitalea chrysea TaxID=1647581 RepID=A0A9W6EUK8_9FLAO|nr:hypothetical protein [Neptunitalea chrysea]GLB53630.1 hypothetical protein NBRC110019_26710 [Neptunitalea chrysea]
MKTELNLESSIELCQLFFEANKVAEKEALGQDLITYIEKSSIQNKAFIETVLAPVLQLHVDTFNCTKIKLKIDNLKSIVSNFYIKEEVA